MNVLIGLPIYDRAWIVPDWFAAIEQQNFPLENLGFIFITAPHDPETIRELVRWSEAHPQVTCFDIVTNYDEPHDGHPEGSRIWTHAKYAKMATLRNQLLDLVTCREPDLFFSLDSDILLENPNTIRYLAQLSAHLPAISPLLYMTPQNIDFPSTMSWLDNPGERAARAPDYPIGTVFQTDVIMAAKMMTPDVYRRVRYEFHHQGEDLGWSAQAARLGIPLYAATTIYCPHIMSRSKLLEYKESGDIRKGIVNGRNSQS